VVGVAQLFWLTNEKEAYQAMCSTMALQDSGQEPGFQLRGHLIGGDEVDTDAKVLVQQAETLVRNCHTGNGPSHDQRKAMRGNPMTGHRGPGRPNVTTSFGSSFYVTGWAHYRAMNYEQAVKTLEDACRYRWPGRDIGWPLLAMSYHQLGNPTKAKTALERSQSLMDKWLDEAMESDRATPIPWVDWIEFLVHYREATDMIVGEASLDPRLGLLRERALQSIAP
jgi:hypothetical protein